MTDRLESPLVSVDQLHRWLRSGRPGLRIVDVRWYLGKPAGAGRVAFEQGHIPGAVHADVDVDLVAADGPGRHPLPDPATFAARMAALGVTDGDTVVAYDDVGGWVAARLWWMLDDLGFGRDGRGGAAVLDGGWTTWVAAGLPTESGPATPRSERAAPLALAPAWRRVIDRPDLKARLGRDVLLDARAGPRYRGEIEPIDPAPGHIPTAVSAPTDGNLGPDGRFLDAASLRDRFHALGADGGRVISSCGSGVSACHNALAMRIAGLPDPILYPGSYSDWSRSGEPVVTGSEPGEPIVTGSEPGDPPPGDGRA